MHIMDVYHDVQHASRILYSNASKTHSLLFVGEDNVSMECLHHEQRLTQCARSLPQDLVWLHGDDRAKGKDERVNVLHVEVEGCHGVGYRVIGQTLRRTSDQH